MECLGSYVITWGLLFTEYKPWSQSPCFKQCIGEYLDSRCLIPHPVSGGNVLDVAIIHILDGEATEPRIKDLDEDREESPDPGVWVCNSRSSSWVWQTWNYSGHGLCLLESREDLYFGANPLASDINSILRGWAWGIQTIWALLDILKCCGWSCSQSERSFSVSGARHQFFLRKQCCHCTLFCSYQWDDEQGISVPLWGDETHDNTHMYRAQISSHIICLCHACTYGYPSTSISCPYPPCPYTYLFSLTSLYHLWHLSHSLCLHAPSSCSYHYTPIWLTFFIIPMILFPLYPHAFFIPILILTTYCAHVLPSSLLIEEVPKPKEMCQSPRLFSVSLLRKGQVNHAKVFKASKWFSGLNWLFLYSQVHQIWSPMKIWAVLIDLGLGLWT